MSLSAMRALVRRDLKDEDASNYRWTDDEIDRAIQRAVSVFSNYCPRTIITAIATTLGSYQVDISSLTPRLSVDAVEFPTGKEPPSFILFNVHMDTLYLEVIGTGANCNIYWSSVHSIGASTTIPAQHTDLVALGAAAYAAISLAQFRTDRVNYGGSEVDRDYRSWGEARLREFTIGCKQLKSKVISRRLTI